MQDLQYKKVDTTTKGLKSGKVQAIADKIEIMRDLATYESNYANLKSDEPPRCREHMAMLLSEVKVVRANCMRTLRFDPEEDTCHFSDNSNIHTFMDVNYNDLLSPMTPKEGT